jgi:hypothetical protein
MNEYRSVVRAPAPSGLGFEETIPTAQQRYGAIAACVTLVLAASLAARFGMHQGPVIRPFVPITATVWALADLLTAFSPRNFSSTAVRCSGFSQAGLPSAAC